MLNSFHSVVIETPDLELGIHQYQQLLGTDAPRIEVNAARNTRSALFSLQNMRLELRTSDPTLPLAEPRLAGIRLAGPTSEGIDAGLAAAAVPHAPARQEQAERLESAVAEAVEGVDPRRFRSITIDPAMSRGLEVELISEESPQGLPTGAGADAGDAASIRGLDHVVVFSRAPDSTRRFYEDALGIRLALDRTFEERGVRLLFFRLGGATIEIGGRLNTEVDEDSSDRFGGLAWKVGDLDAIATRLAQAGVDVSEVRKGHKAGTRVCTVRDQTQGVPTLLIEPVSA